MCLMKNLIKSISLLAVAAMGLSACNEQNLTPEQVGKGELVTVHFGANSSIESPTKATLTTEDEKTFKSAWEDGDVLSVEYSNDGATNATGKVEAKWVDTTSSFDTTLPEYTGTWTYDAVYPAPNAKGEVDFGSARVQNGNAYNSKYDLMFGEAVAENAPAGKTDDGKDVIFNMDRQTGIVYFHLTSALDEEEVVSATLSVSESIASSLVMPNNEYSKGFDISLVDLKDITITFAEGTAPKASDFKLWFNVIPTPYETMSLHVETTGHTLDISRSAKGGIEEFVAGKLYKTVATVPDVKWVAKSTPVIYSWVATELVDIAADDEVVITMSKGGTTYALSSSKGSSSAPDAVVVEVVSNELTKEPGDSLVWNILNSNGNLTIYPNGVTDSWLYSTSDNNGIRVGNNTTAIDNKLFKVEDDYGYLMNVSQKRYMGVYSGSEWRSYTSMHANIKDQILCFYVKSTPKTALDTPANLSVSAAKVVSWDAVSGAASYNVTIGSETYTSETNSYDASAIEDEYYDVSVVAVPSDKDNYKNSAAATLTAVKFGTPTLATPVLKEGAIDESSIRVNMTVDARATNGCLCEIYNGETLVESKTIKVNYVVFDSLNDGVTYTVKVNAVAVEGEKSYAASDVASIELKTKASQHVSDVTEAGTYTIKGLTVYEVPNTSNAIMGDGTGFILLYKKSHGLKVGNTCDVAGTVKEYNGVWEFDSPSITGKITGETPVYPDAIEADEAYLISYASSSKVEYVHAKGIQNGKNIKVGEQTLYMSKEESETDGKNVEVSGFVYGYNTEYKSASFVATSINVDNTAPSLSVDQTSKIWATDATDAFVVNVSVNSEGGDWTVTPETLDWATIVVDKAAGTITITPNGANETETANEAILTITHASDASLTAEISLKQNGKGGIMPISFSVTGTEITSGTVKFKAETGNGSSAPAYNPLRLYANNTITIEDSANPISKIEIEFTKQGNKDYIETLTADSGTIISGGKSTDSSKPVTDTWTSSTTPTKKVVFTLGNKGQRVIKSVKVYF